jgi:acyl carrier protein
MSADIFAKVQTVVADKLDVDAVKITPEASFTNDLGADSLDVVELVMALEEEFDVEIPDEEAEKLQTVQSVVDQHQNQEVVSFGKVIKGQRSLMTLPFYNFYPLTLISLVTWRIQTASELLSLVSARSLRSATPLMNTGQV